jgi:hypothetical protein
MSGGTFGETERRRGAFLVGTAVVRLRGGGVGMGRNCFLDSALFTQKWIVVFGRLGFSESPSMAKDQPASQRERRRDSASGRVRDSRKLTSSWGSRVFWAIALWYSVFEVSYGAKGARILYGRVESMNLYFFWIWPVSWQCLYLALIKIVSKKSPQTPRTPRQEKISARGFLFFRSQI